MGPGMLERYNPVLGCFNTLVEVICEHIVGTLTFMHPGFNVKISINPKIFLSMVIPVLLILNFFINYYRPIDCNLYSKLMMIF